MGEDAAQLIAQTRHSKELGEVRIKLLGRSGSLNNLLKEMGQLAAEDRPWYGELCNRLREEVTRLLAAQEEEFTQREKESTLLAEKIDLTLPGQMRARGSWHPVSLAQEQMESIFLGIGFSIVTGPEVETDYYNFQAMNIPKDHPAREMQDTFYLTDDLLLRTHTSPMQARTMERFAPQIPLKVIVPGKTYRRDEDATHTPMFHQIEGLYVDRDVSLAHLKGVLLHFAREMFGREREIRLRPSFFPFTEPSVEVDISCFHCGGTGCRLCKQTGWIEILGAGMVHPHVLQGSGYDPEEVNGFAFGLGIDRVAMLKFGLDDLRALFTNDVRLLKTFH
ncbi:MAG: phenylalanine--tRNA ligase subunit alpha [Symbiobacteriaceae bacterium]|nr:phenylalanine--tRNA ligase subunit alpha [Symbiobacteriaceae bacterium]